MKKPSKMSIYTTIGILVLIITGVIGVWYDVRSIGLLPMLFVSAVVTGIIGYNSED